MSMPPAKCGTTGGYRRHGRQGEQPCRPCKTAKAEYSRQYRQRNRDRLSQYQRVVRLGPQADQFPAMKKVQNNRCAICEEVAPLAMDHDHVSGLVRALLCGRCNRGLGLFRDDPFLLRKAAAYVLDHR